MRSVKFTIEVQYRNDPFGLLTILETTDEQEYERQYAAISAAMEQSDPGIVYLKGNKISEPGVMRGGRFVPLA